MRPDHRAVPAVFLANVCAQVSVTASGVLPLPLLPVAVGLLTGCALLGCRADAGRGVRLRTVATIGCLVLAAVSVPQLVAASDSAGMRQVLGPLLVGVQIAQALLWRTRRDLQVGLLVAVGLLVLGASYAPDVVAGLPLLAGWPAGLLAGSALVAQREREQSVDPVAARPAVAATALAVALGLVVFLLVPVPKTAGLRSRLAAGDRAAATATGRAAALAGGPLDLRVRGALSDTPVANVDATSPALWRSTTYDRYDGRTWQPVQGQPVQGQPVQGQPGQGQPGQGQRPRSPYVLPEIAGPGPADTPGATRQDEVTVLAAAVGLWAPGLIITVTAPSPLVPDGVGGVSVLRPVSSYTVSSVVAATGERLRQAPPVAAEPRWLQLPAELPPRVRVLARQLTAGRPSRYDAVRSVERWLAAHASYRLDSPVPGPGQDAIDRFLFVDRTGFCEQFAAAETVLLRAAGVPARLVTGLAYGTDAPAGRRTFRERDRHAWVEVPYGGAGWVASDPTAGAVPAALSTSLRARVSAHLAAALRRTAELPGGRPALAAGLLVIVLAARARARASRWTRRWSSLPTAGWRRAGWRRAGWRRAGWPRGERTGAGGSPPASEAIRAFLRLDVRLGPAGRRPAETVREMAARLGLVGVQALAFAAVEQQCYGPPPHDVAGAAAVLDVMTVADARQPERAVTHRAGSPGRLT